VGAPQVTSINGGLASPGRDRGSPHGGGAQRGPPFAALAVWSIGGRGLRARAVASRLPRLRRAQSRRRI